MSIYQTKHANNQCIVATNLFLYVWSSIVHDHKITPIDKKSAITWCSEKRANIEDSKLFEKFVGKIDEA